MPRLHLIAAAAFLTLSCGCSSTPAIRYYVLSPTAEAPARRAAPVAVIITDLRLPQYLERSQIVTRGGDHRLQISEYELWAGNLREDMTRVLAENLGRLLASDRVISAPHNLRLKPDYRVEVEVLRFERESGGRVGLSARWWLTRGSDAALLTSSGEMLFGAPLGENASYDALVASMSSVYGELAQAIARSIRSRGVEGS
ncbi:MAG: membrane integrity-associated transporter subunit PqiC [Betaproteobacteria bacterium]|nr:membrane integrity-associated transporter subunit PqiC [Betaproteobacteria bacterium]